MASFWSGWRDLCGVMVAACLLVATVGWIASSVHRWRSNRRARAFWSRLSVLLNAKGHIYDRVRRTGLWKEVGFYPPEDTEAIAILTALEHKL